MRNYRYKNKSIKYNKMADYKISFHYDGVLINMETFPFDDERLLFDTASKMILQTLQKGVDSNRQIPTYHRVLKGAVYKLKKNRYISRFDKRLCSLGIISLIKLKSLKNDNKNGFIIVKNKSKIKQIDPNWIKLLN
jgi:hypothetical protein